MTSNPAAHAESVRPDRLLHGGRLRVPFNDRWHFRRGDAPGAEQPEFDASTWRRLRLPHDWAIEGPFDTRHNARAGGLPIDGVGWYRKRFHLPATARGKVVTIEFDGAMYNSEVWVNGHFLGRRPFGYIGFQYDMSDHLDYGGDNVVAVRLSPEYDSSRWYPGAGLYRKVWIEFKDTVHVGHWGTMITTPRVRASEATVRVETTIVTRGAGGAQVSVSNVLRDPAGHEVGQAATDLAIAGGSEARVVHEIIVPRPERWDTASPFLYQAQTAVHGGGALLDTVETRFGIRTIEFNAKEGFLLNGRVVRLQGVCMHHDLGALGAAVNHRAIERQLEIMKAMGANAVRTSHNPPAPEVVALCDRMGILLQVEAFDAWEIAKVPNDYSRYFRQWHERDLRDMIRRDRNSPSVIMWSIGNEILEQVHDEGRVLARALTRIAHEEDPTRPVTAGLNKYPEPLENGMADELDLVGLNYKPMFYDVQKKRHPEWVIYGAETASCTSSRGEYHFPIEAYGKHPSLQVTGYDVIAPFWAYAPDLEFRALEENPSALGEFVWTGFDYLGEPTPFGGWDNFTDGRWNDDWPARSSYFGAVDLAGFPKDRFYLYQSQWTSDPMVHVLPHWNWEDRPGDPIPVMCYTNCDEVELFVNGESFGRKRRGTEPTDLPSTYQFLTDKVIATRYRLRWDVPYAPGSLRVVAWRDGKVAAEKEIRTAGAPARVTLTTDRSDLAADGEDLSFVTVRIEDAEGNLCPRADHLVTFSLDGPGQIAAVDNGNAATTDPFQADWRRAFNGLALVVLRGQRGASGVVKLSATAEGLDPGHTRIHLR